MERLPFRAAARLVFALAMAAALLIPQSIQAQDKQPILVLAAASLKNALDEAAATGPGCPASRFVRATPQHPPLPNRSKKAHRPTSFCPPTCGGWIISTSKS